MNLIAAANLSWGESILVMILLGVPALGIALAIGVGYLVIRSRRRASVPPPLPPDHIPLDSSACGTRLNERNVVHHMTSQSPDTLPTDPRIIGFWKGVNGDYSLINEYRPDGTCLQHVGNRAGRPSPFRIEGDHVIYSLEQPDGSISETKTQYEISEDTLTFIYGSKKMHFVRTQEA